MTTKATPGAIRAAREINRGAMNGDRRNFEMNHDLAVEIIDRETAAPEMLEALEFLIDAHEAISNADRQSHLNHALTRHRLATKKAQAAIQKARGGA